jgi:hypothetical protein
MVLVLLCCCCCCPQSLGEVNTRGKPQVLAEHQFNKMALVEEAEGWQEVVAMFWQMGEEAARSAGGGVGGW